LNVALDGNGGLNRSVVAYTVGGLNWLPGQTLTLRWTGEDLSDQDDGLAIDDLFFSASASSQLGDFDGDNDVDGADFVAWQTNFPKSSGATRAMGDADADGDVDGADFVIWQTNFPTSSGGGVAPQAAAATGVPTAGSGNAISVPPAPNNSTSSFEPPLAAAKRGSNQEGTAATAPDVTSERGTEETAKPPRPAAPKFAAVANRVPNLASQSPKAEPAHATAPTDGITPSEPQKLRLTIVDQLFEHDSMYRSRHFGRAAVKPSERLW
jgi:hypothetical protein